MYSNFNLNLIHISNKYFIESKTGEILRFKIRKKRKYFPSELTCSIVNFTQAQRRPVYKSGLKRDPLFDKRETVRW